MIRQPVRGSRRVNDMFYDHETRQIEKINSLLKGVDLTRSEEAVMVWLAGWEDETVDGVLSVMRKVAKRCP